MMKIRKQIFAVFISACLVVGMLPSVSFAAEANGIDISGPCEHHTAHDEACGYAAGSEGSPCTHEHGAECGAEGAGCTHEHDETCGYVPAVEGHPCTYVCELCRLTEIMAWSWVDESAVIDPSSGILALSGAESPVLYDEIVDILPAQITAATENGTETLTLGGWMCDNYPGEGANTGSYLFTAVLPEGYALTGNVPTLTVAVEFGGVAVQDGEHSDHPICGATHKDIGDHTGTCNDVTWTAWDGTSEISYDADTKTAYVYLMGDVTRDDCFEVGKGHTLYLCLNGHSIKSSYAGEAISVTGSAKFILCNCQSGGAITHSDGVLGKGVKVGTHSSDIATFIMYGGTINGNRAGTSDSKEDGAGVAIGGSGRFTMYGGAISDNHVDAALNYGGGGVLCNGRFIMYGGTISGNTVTGEGGGVVAWGSSASAAMYGGTISGNTATGDGGGICTNNPLIISGNSVIENNKAANGGGVYFYGYYSDESLTISDSVKIAGNTATGNGGGIAVSNGGALTINGGSITGNSAEGNGGGVYFGSKHTNAFKIAGSVEINGNKKGSTDNNVYLPTGKYITIVGELTGSKIGVTTEKVPGASNYVRIAYSSNKNYADPEKFQYENDGTLSVSAVGTSSINLVVCKHSVSSDWSADESGHWHTCSICKAKIGVTAHTYDQKVVSEAYKKSDATCTSKAIYYMSCVCGMKGTETFESGDTNPDNHSGTLGDWKSDGSSHWKEYSCCGLHAETGAHTPGPAATEDAPQTCTECGYELAPALEHTHDWGDWTSNGDGTHSRICSKDPSHTEKDNCSGGTATCQSRAVCTVCSQPYGEKDMTNHTGTEVRGRVEATTTSEGYTGDIYCKDCNTKISDGTTIPKIDSGSGSGNSTNTGSGSGTAGNTPSAPVTAPAAEETAPVYDLYIVQRGDTLIKLARKYGCTVAEIVAANRDLIKDAHWIYPGWELRIPQDNATGTEPQDETTTTENKKIDLYIVKKGDTLNKLARRYGCTVAEIVVANSGLIKDPHWIYPGWELRIPLN